MMKELEISFSDIDYLDHDILRLKNNNYYRIDRKEDLLKSISVIDNRNEIKYGKELLIKSLKNTDYFYIKQGF